MLDSVDAGHTDRKEDRDRKRESENERGGSEIFNLFRAFVSLQSHPPSCVNDLRARHAGCQKLWEKGVRIGTRLKF